ISDSHRVPLGLPQRRYQVIDAVHGDDDDAGVAAVLILLFDLDLATVDDGHVHCAGIAENPHVMHSQPLRRGIDRNASWRSRTGSPTPSGSPCTSAGESWLLDLPMRNLARPVPKPAGVERPPRVRLGLLGLFGGHSELSHIIGRGDFSHVSMYPVGVGESLNA